MVSSLRRVNRKAHFDAPGHIRRKIMSAPLSKELRSQHGAPTVWGRDDVHGAWMNTHAAGKEAIFRTIRSIPIRKDDEVTVVRGASRGSEGRIVQVYRAKWVVHIERLQKEKANGATVAVPVHPSNVVITKIRMDKDRKNMLARKSGKSAEEIQA
ncbi:60S ribosomal protein L26-2 [Malassezia restricta CBS 7877]|uniref:60S ribosomal protein L26-2 n=1 Tax=Malassezia restricta (strain ATCC 96810 / NBRC 103918 / CBS 7877) TaxID=425264 RepID=A0A3G2S7U6_MALR7|nr:60S ribosomal protein L26-2 [Malassezia restricta CBS 7877]